MKSSLTILALCLASLLGAGLHHSAQQPSPIQLALERLPISDGTLHSKSLQGGTVALTPGAGQLGSTTLLIPSAATLKGDGLMATRLIASTRAAAFHTKGGSRQHQGGTIEALSILSEGDGIGIASTNETIAPTIRDVVLDCAGTAIDLSNGQTVYAAVLRNVHIRGAGICAINAPNVRQISISGLYFNGNMRRPTTKGALFKLGGSGGKIEDTWIESDWPGPLLELKGPGGVWNLSNCWIEPHRSGSSIVLDNVTVTIDQTNTLFAWPSQPVVLKNAATLIVTGSLGFTDDNGGKPSDAAGIAALAKRCFQCDGTSRVVNMGRVVVGM